MKSTRWLDTLTPVELQNEVNLFLFSDKRIGDWFRLSEVDLMAYRDIDFDESMNIFGVPLRQALIIFRANIDKVATGWLPTI